MRYVISALAVLQGGYMLIDGLRALVTGEYITPSSGAYAGQVGPWASVVRAVGLSPDMVAMKVVFIVLGLAWLVTAVGVAIPASWAWTATMILAVASLWYAIPGTVISLAILAMLWLPSVRQEL